MQFVWFKNGERKKSMEWEGCRYFLALSRRGSHKLAARDLGVNLTTVGRQIERLEADLKVKLFERHAKGYVLTVAGERMLELVKEIEERFLSIERQIMGRDERLHGKLKLALPGALANHLLIPLLASFCENHPQIEIQFVTGPEVVNLARREADLAIRLVRPNQADLLVKKFGRFDLGFYCTRESYKQYLSLKERGEPVPFIDLYAGATSRSQNSLMAKEKTEWSTVMRSSAWSSVYQAVNAGIGVGILPDFLAKKSESLRLWNDLIEPITLWLVVHPDIAKSSRVRALIAFLEGKL